MTPGEVTAVLREHAMQSQLEHDQQVALAWNIAALERSKRLPRLQRLLHRRRRKASTGLAPAVMTEGRRRRIALLARGLTLADDIDPYKRGDDDDEE